MSEAVTPALSDLPLTQLRGVGPKSVERLQDLGIETVLDLLLYLPIRYEDRSRLSWVSDLQLGESTHVQGTLLSSRVMYGKRRQLVCQLQDETGVLTLRFFYFSPRQQQMLNQVGLPIRVYGVVRQGRSGIEMVHPAYELGEVARQPFAKVTHYAAVYRSIQGINNAFWPKVMAQACELLRQNPALLVDGVPARLRGELRLPSLQEALLFVHHPPIAIPELVLQQRSHPAFKRLALEEMMAHQLALRASQPAVSADAALPIKNQLGHAASLVEKLLRQLPFQLTAAQQRVIAEIATDCERTKPMLRLLQGDVGSGKTLVAAVAVCQALDSGFQVAVMAPTEILAQQHRRCFQHWLEPLGIAVDFLVGGLTAKDRRETLARLADGTARVVVGTHALFQQAVEFDNLGFLVIDEQHRFGVAQRLALRDKSKDGVEPHQLVMTATPIPRSLAMTAYSHCDHSIIDELPPGRQPIQTALIAQTKREQVMERLNEQLAAGARVYWVCPLIEESDSLDLQTIQSSYEDLSASLPGYSVELLHGRLTAAEKDQVMQRFASGDSQVLVATTVIEVGVDVPEATVMIIENAERFGLAQLHQLRGRVGRGSAASHCILIYGKVSESGRERLQVMRECADGFRVAEADLRIRGPGELLGDKQAGFFQFQIADWQRDADLLPLIEQITQEMTSEYLLKYQLCRSSWFKSDQKWTKA